MTPLFLAPPPTDTESVVYRRLVLCVHALETFSFYLYRTRTLLCLVKYYVKLKANTDSTWSMPAAWPRITRQC